MFDTTNAACIGEDPDLFFPEGVKGSAIKVRQAKAICAGCPIALQCLAEAINTNMAGIWGGTTEAERKAIRGTKRIDILKHLE